MIVYWYQSGQLSFQDGDYFGWNGNSYLLIHLKWNTPYNIVSHFLIGRKILSDIYMCMSSTQIKMFSIYSSSYVAAFNIFIKFGRKRMSTFNLDRITYWDNPNTVGSPWNFDTFLNKWSINLIYSEIQKSTNIDWFNWKLLNFIILSSFNLIHI